jgi:hypothetical protein
MREKKLPGLGMTLTMGSHLSAQKKKEKKKKTRERGATGGLAWLDRCPAGPRVWPSWGAVPFFLFLFFLFYVFSFVD